MCVVGAGGGVRGADGAVLDDTTELAELLAIGADEGALGHGGRAPWLSVALILVVADLHLVALHVGEERDIGGGENAAGGESDLSPWLEDEAVVHDRVRVDGGPATRDGVVGGLGGVVGDDCAGVGLESVGNVRGVVLDNSSIPRVDLVAVGPDNNDNVIGRLVLELDLEWAVATNSDWGVGVAGSGEVQSSLDTLDGKGVGRFGIGTTKAHDSSESGSVGCGDELERLTLLESSAMSVSVSMAVRNARSIGEGGSAEDGGNDRLHVDNV